MFSKLTFLNDIDVSNFNFLEFKGTICSDSRKVKPGDIFIAYKGNNYDGRDFINDAVKQKAAVIIYDSNDNFHYDQVYDKKLKFIAIKNLRQYAGIICSHILGNNLSNIPIIGITGTNGKTSISFLLAQLLELMGVKTGIIGTLGHGFINKLINTNETTPDMVNLQNYIHKLLKSNSKVITIEVSSHGLDQFRLNGVNFHTAIFTNLTQDHLDYHKSIGNYAQIKSRLFYWNNLKHAIINIDDEYGKILCEQLRVNNKNLNITTYGINSNANVKINAIKFNLYGSVINLHTPWGNCILRTSLIGNFNALNISACLSAICGLGYPLDETINFVSKIKPISGRLEKISNDLKPTVIIDYAHTPDALKNSLLTLKEAISGNGKLWCVFGCGGNRDKSKRNLMGEIASQYADKVIVTSDNPRFEEPEDIINDILNLNQKITKSIVSRKSAIKYAIVNADYNDIILIAGKGHEQYQDIKGKKYLFNDTACAYEYLMQLRN